MSTLKWVLAAAGIVLLVAVDWRIAAGVFLLLWADNMAQHGI